jgi:hypothetical protein
MSQYDVLLDGDELPRTSRLAAGGVGVVSPPGV